MDKLDEIRALAIRHAGVKHPGMPRLSIYRINEPTELNALVYDPVALIVLQGTKRTIIGDKLFEYGPGQTMVVAAEITAMGQVIEASPDKPFLAVNLNLDPAVIMNVVLYLSETPELQMQPGFAFSIANVELIGAWQRLLQMYERPKEIPVMALHLEHELMFRLMLSPHA
jgi:AraC-type transcriptional regulator